MRALKRLAAMAAMVAVTGLCGCSAPESAGTVDMAAGGMPPGHAGSGPNEDGRLCGTTRVGAVYIQVGYDASGMPVVNPDLCHVTAGTRITWRGPDNDQRAFEIAFKAGSASENGQARIPSEAGPEGSRARIVAANAHGSYAYSVRANGRELDPQIIIDPR